MVVNSKNYHPTIFTRFVVYPLILVFFLLLLSYVLMIANGYKLSFRNNKAEFVKTGMIIVGTRPGDAKIILNNKFKKRTTLSFLNVKYAGLVPGIYSLKIEKVGFRTWQNSLNVVTDLVTWANYVLLFPNELKIEDVELPVYKQIAKSDNGRHVLFTTQKDGKFALINYDLNNKNESNIWPTQLPENTPWLVEPIIKNATFSPNSDKVLLTIDNSGVNHYVTIENGIGNSHLNLYKPTDLLKDSITGVSWVGEDNNRIVFYTKTGLMILPSAFDGDQNIQINGDIVASSVIRGNEIIFVRKDLSGVFQLVKYSGSTENIIDKSLLPSDKYVLSESSTGKFVSLLNANTKELTVYYQEGGKFISTLLSTGINSHQWNKNESKVSYFSDSQVFTYDFVKNVESSFSTTNKISQITYYYDESHFLINDGSLYVVDFDGTNKVEISTKVSEYNVDKINNNILFSSLDDALKTVYKRYISEI